MSEPTRESVRQKLVEMQTAGADHQEVLAYLQRVKERRGHLSPEQRPTAADPVAAVVELVRRLIADHTGTPLERVRPDQRLDRIGFDSVMALEVVRGLRPHFGEVGMGLLFDSETPRGMAERLVRDHPERAAALVDSDRNTGTAPATPTGTATPEKPSPAGPTDERTREADRSHRPDGSPAGRASVVGLAGRFPGAGSVAEFWDVLASGRDCVGPVPADRWDHEAYAASAPGRPGTSYLTRGAFLDHPDAFDADFFAISPKQARFMDPQERLLLQETWHALEDAGIPTTALAGRPVGVYVGVMYADYGEWAHRAEGIDYLASSHASIANRISYTYDLRGPSMAVDTMCSSSLTALDLACTALASGEIDVAIVAGVNLTTHPRKFVDLSQGRFASVSGACRAFGEGADGYVPGEAVVVAVLTRPEVADRDGLRPWGHIDGIAIGHGGRTTGYSAPNPSDQEAVIRRAQERAGVRPGDVSYIEAHGTGTSLGDPIEVDALARVFGDAEPRSTPCAIGSVKSNVGHCEAAAGLVGLTKVLLQLWHDTLAPSLHAEQLNPRLALGDRLTIQRSKAPWAAGRPRHAGLSSFGAGGSSAHVVVTEALPGRAPSAAAPEARRPRAFAVSAPTSEALRTQLVALADAVTSVAASSQDVAYTLAHGRTRLDVRTVLLAADLSELAALARATASAADPSGMHGTGSPDLSAVAAAWCRGEEVDLLGGATGRLVELPGYTFATTSYWHRPLAGDDTARKVAVDDPRLADHVVGGVPVLSAAAVLDLLADELGGRGETVVVEDIVFRAPLTGGPDGLSFSLHRTGDSFELRDVGGRLCVQGRGRLAGADGALPNMADAPLDVPLTPASEIYPRFAAAGLAYGPSYRLLEQVSARGSGAWGVLASSAGRTGVLDAALQTMIGFASDDHGGLPFCLRRVVLGPDTVRARRVAAHRDGASTDILLADAEGRTVASLEGVVVLASPLLASARTGILRETWGPAETGSVMTAPTVAIWAADAGTGRLAAALEAHGAAVRAVTPPTLPSDADVLVDLRFLAGQGLREAITAFGPTMSALTGRLAEGGAALRRIEVRRCGDPGIRTGAALDRTLAVEDGRYRGRGVLVPGGSVDVERLAAEVLLDSDWGGIVRLGDGRRESLHLSLEHPLPQPTEGAAGPAVRPGGRYLVTGALGGIGRMLCRTLADRYGADLTLVGRRDAPAELEALLGEITAAGGRARYVAADLATAAGARRAVDAALADGPVDGVFHLAGVVRDALAVRKRSEDAEAVLAAKALSLAEVTDALAEAGAAPWVICFGSASAYVGVPGQVDYAYANAAVAAWTEQTGLRAVTVEWPLLESVGMGVPAGVRQRLEAHLGWRPMPWTGVADVLAWTAATDDKVVRPVFGDPATIRRWLEHFAGTPQAAAATGPVLHAPTSDRPAPEPSGAPAPVPAAFVDHLARLIGDELGLAGPLDADRSFDRVGLESVMVMNITAALDADLGSVPSTVLFQYRTVHELADGLWGSHRDQVLALLGDSAAEPAAERGGVPGSAAPAPARPAPEPVVAPLPPQTPPFPEDDPIVIVGIAGRFPKSPDLEALWENLRTGTDCVVEVGDDRWDHAALLDDRPGVPGRTYARWAGLLDDIDLFDAAHFHISAREARAMDPQERLFLETSWHALEAAGFAPDDPALGRCGVYAGTMYAQYQMYGSDPAVTESGALPASQHAAVANRVSYALDLTGPSLTVDTMCSSSLTALHLACQALRAGDCESALVGGVNVISHPYRFLQMAAGRFAARDGRCRSFGAGGTGYVPGEGVGVALLMPLSRAWAAGAHVEAVIRGSAVSHGGRTNGFTVPSVPAQAEVIRTALDKAGIDGTAIDYVEAHGTGTELGDPIEVAALQEALGRRDGRALPVGSIKSNLGHLEPAAGMAGLAKIILQMRHRALVPSLHSDEPNPFIDFSGIVVQHDFEPWESATGTPLIAALSSFGAGGSNAHVILEEPPVVALPDEPAGVRHVVPLSGGSREQVLLGAAQLARALERSEGVRLVDVVHTLAVGRARGDYRAAVVAGSLDELAAGLRALTEERSVPGVLPVTGPGDRPDDVVADLLSGPSGHRFVLDLQERGELDRIARLWCLGLDLDLAPRGGRRITLPGTVFRKVRHWITDRVAQQPDETRGTGFPAAPTPTVGTHQDVPPAPATGAEAIPSPAGPSTPAPVPVEAAPAPRVAQQRRPSAELVREAMATVLEVPAEELDPTASHTNHGVDSVLAVEIADRISRESGVEVKPTDIFSYASIRELAAYVDTLLPAAPTAEAVPPAGGPPPAESATPVTAPTAHTRSVAVGETSQELAPPALSEGPSAVAGPVDDVEIAIIGWSAMFPGADDIESFWANLRDGRDSVTEVPPTRWDVDLHVDPDPAAPGKSYSRWAGVIERPDLFDPDRFGMSPREAQLADPQHRLLLQEGWRALENAGYPAETLAGRNIPVYVGGAAGDYREYLAGHGLRPEGYLFTGTSAAVLSSRLSYALNLSGPSMTVDTSCSSSLLSIHLAAQAIREGRCEMAVAGGVALLFTPDLHILASKSRMLSPRGRCHAFDAEADGFVPGEGAGVVILKRLDAAIRDGDRVIATVIASGTNQDGRSNGITAPSMTAQRDLERAVYAAGGIDPADIGYVECHGTGTRLGDPIEIEALRHAFGEQPARSCALGSVKSNIGHALTAAGLAGFVKAALCLEHQTLVPTLHVKTVNPLLELGSGGFYLSTERAPFPAPRTGRRLAAVSAFGFSGTNVHAVLAEAPAVPRPADPVRVDLLLPVSAPTREQLDELLERLARRVDQLDVRDVAYTLQHRRTHYAVRALAVLHPGGSAAEALRAATSTPVPAGGIAARYLAGEAVDWPAPAPGARVADLPGLPLALTSQWPVPGVFPAGRAASTGGNGGGRTVHLRPSDPLVADHVVAGAPVLPAAGHLELVVDLVRERTGWAGFELRKCVFLRPVIVDAELDLTVSLLEDGDGLRFTVSSGSGLLHSRGEVVRATPEASYPDVAAARARCDREMDARVHYHRFRGVGVRYGESYRTVTAIRAGHDTVVASLMALGDGVAHLPAPWLDGAIQTVAALHDPAEESSPTLPFAIDRLVVAAPLRGALTVVVEQQSPDRATLRLVGEDGRELVLVDGLLSRRLPETTALHVLHPTWTADDLPRAQSVPPPGPDDLVVVESRTGPVAYALIGDRRTAVPLGDPAIEDQVVEWAARGAGGRVVLALNGAGADHGWRACDPAYERATIGLPVVRILRALARSGGTYTLDVVTVAAAAVPGFEQARPIAAHVTGLVRSLSREHPSWTVRIADIDSATARSAAAPDVVASALAAAGAGGGLCCVRGGRAWSRGLSPDSPSDGARVVPARRGGVYVIFGGAGGIGAETALALAEKHAAHVVLAGRRPADDRTRELVALVRAAGGSAEYDQADLADLDQVTHLLRRTRASWGPISGVYHSALVLHDVPMAAMTDESYDAVCRPKMEGLHNVLTACAGEDLDHLVVYSSMQSFVCNPGQGNYAAAGLYADALMDGARAGGLPVRLVNWGYWGEVGVVSHPRYRAAMAAEGVGSIGAGEGMRAVAGVLAGDGHQTVVVRSTPEVLDRLSMPGAGTPATPTPSSYDRARIVDLVTHHAELEELGLRWARLVLAEVGVLTPAGDVADETHWAAQVRPARFPLVRAIVGHLHATIGTAGGGESPDTLRVALRVHGERHPDLAPQVALLVSCLESYAALLRGERESTEVMFPGSSMELVEGVYRADPLIAGLSRHAAQALVGECLTANKALTVLEVGAGTGGTTSVVQPALRQCGAPYTYLYTDLSAGFLAHGRREFGRDDPSMRFLRFDVEAEPAGQGIEPGSVDAVVAANVLHATNDLRRTLRNIAATLRPGGTLTLIETTSVSPFATLTFGLLDGWWVFADGVREPHSPLASVETWTRLLKESGFATVEVSPSLADLGVGVGQHVFHARLADRGSLEVPPEAPAAVSATASPTAATGGATAGQAAADESAIAARIAEVICQVLRREQGSLDHEQPFAEYGVDSIILVELVGELNAALGVELDNTALFDNPTIAQLARAVAQTAPSEPTAPPSPPSASSALTPPATEMDELALLEALAAGTCSVEDVELMMEDYR